MADRVRPLKNESPAEGGTEDDIGFPAVIDPEEDELACAGVVLGEAGKDGSDLIVRIYRSADKMYFKDTENTGANVRSLTDLAAAASSIDSIMVDDVTGDVLTDDVTLNVLVDA